ncbi:MULTISPECIES: murein L,D-transpeptidase [unclassified Massilia]|uniref:L,D-transpeptidase family protein n=1 Tax=unclassified Massilia TaxID=2609279 RepID=UPI00178593C0|nr:MULTISPECIES: L,D-transpeptidase family protein [unclassified Massilia]MBD8531012.1 L,D-transpeptidase family protein [Massilia sp. CFBP 13647]MBD8674712.1 L,D-transpeptidase family protein [Massilia sp. CFBP 13721]
MKLSQKIGVALVLCAVAALVPALVPGFAHATAGARPAPAAIHALSAQASQSTVVPTGPYDERGWLDRFYGPRKYAPAWNPSTAAAALWVLGQARLQGLDPLDYGTDALQRELRAGKADSVRFDVALTAAMLRYLADLRVGRVRSEYHTRLPDPRLKQYDPVERLRAGLAAGKLQAAVQAAQPTIWQYGHVKAALAAYRTLSGQPYPALPRPAAKAVPGSAYPGAQALHARLVLLGDLPADAPLPPDGIYDERMEEGVRHFQARHGLSDDGMLGRGTIDALNVPPARRVRQLELTLERLRWLPDVGPGPLILVDLPAYRLWALQNAGSATAPLEMRVVVGSAVKTETPLFVGQMRYLEFNPYWNVPRSILDKELLPKLKRNPAYLAQNEMETVPAGASVADLQAGRARVRQRPGLKNALGAIKFALPNPMDIYLHSTPAREAFQRSRRDLSHGCIRVEHPAALAQYVLGRQLQWNADTIQEALQPGPTRHVDLVKAIPVVMFYATASVDREGKPRFAADIYGRDPKLEQALAARRRQRVSAAGRPPQ